jgi:hypothetical protein
MGSMGTDTARVFSVRQGAGNGYSNLRRRNYRTNWFSSKRLCHLYHQWTGRVTFPRPVNRLSAGGNRMRWIIRDVGIFLYGCVFASKYIFSRQVARRPQELDAKKSLALSVPPVRLTALKTLQTMR